MGGRLIDYLSEGGVHADQTGLAREGTGKRQERRERGPVAGYVVLVAGNFGRQELWRRTTSVRLCIRERERNGDG